MIDIVSTATWKWLAERSDSARISVSANGRRAAFLSIAVLSAVAAQQPLLAQAAGGIGNSGPLLAQAVPAPIINTPRTTPGSTILPTDVLPLPTIQNRMTFGENLQLRILQKLPARFYFNSSVETSFRIETNVFQYPTKRTLIRKTPSASPAIFPRLPATSQQQILNFLKLASSQDNVYRVLPTATAGWTLSPHTRFYGSFFMIRDSLFKNVRLNTCIYSYTWGIQHDFPIGTRANLTADLNFRELNQMHQHSVFDFLPNLQFTYLATPRTYLFASALAQIRGRKYFQAPTREIDPFYTAGLLHQRGRWTFSATTTFDQNFRQPFGHHALIPANNYMMISDFEIDRRIIPQLPGLQAFVRAEPIWNMHSHNRPGLAGMDFRLYYGLRFSASKPALTTALDSLRKQLEEQEVTPPTPSSPGPKPSAYLSPEEVTAQSPQPIHGTLPEELANGSGTGSASSSDSLLSIHADAVMPPPAAIANAAYTAPVRTIATKRSAAQQIADEESDIQFVTSPAITRQ